MVISANDLKKKGVKFIEELIKKNNEIIISVRGKQKYVVIDVDRYRKLRDSELELAYIEAMKDYKEEKYHTDIETHIKNIS